MAQEEGPVAESRTTSLSAAAPAFVPGGQAAGARDPASTEQANGGLASSVEYTIRPEDLPPQHRRLLRGWFQDPVTGSWGTYFLGRLKSFSNRSGYGFIECAAAKKEWGVDVFVHKNLVRTPWKLCQPVEFAVVQNARGQPQAVDVNWLPWIPQAQPPRTVSAVAPLAAATVLVPAPAASAETTNGASVSPKEDKPSATAAGDPGSAEAEAPPPSPPVVEAPRRPRRYIGTLKSYSRAQGYGFITCNALHQAHSRDVYLDKGQMTEGGWRIGQVIEFEIVQNAKGQPQARRINWDAIPLTGDPDESVQAATSAPGVEAAGNINVLDADTVENMQEILRHISEDDVDTAIVKTIDSQGSGGNCVDFVCFALDRLGDCQQCVKNMRDFVMMLLVLMLSKMLKKKGKIHPRLCQCIEWMDCLSESVNPTVEGVREHFRDVTGQVDLHLSALMGSTSTTELPPAQREIIANVLERLRSKAQDAAVGAPAAGAPNAG